MTLAFKPVPTADIANDDAIARFHRHCAALGLTLPMPDLTPCLGRDGSLTATRDGQWLAGCSVPRRAAERMLRNERWAGRSLCFLTPSHGQQVAAVLAKLPPTAALIVVFADIGDLADALVCGDFTADIAAGRLHVAWDDASLVALFDRHPGLAVPRQIVKLPDADPTATAAAMPWTQAVLGRLTNAHSQRLAAVATNVALSRSPAATQAETSNSSTPAVLESGCLLVGRHFRLWHDAGDTLARIVSQLPESQMTAVSSPIHVIDTDHPLAAAEIFQAERTAAAALTISDRCRPAWATSLQPWIAWLTEPAIAIPTFNPDFARDALLLADDVALAAARIAGWPGDRVAVARWPDLRSPPTQASGAPLALMYDLPDLEPPADITEFSSRQVVWEAIQEELTKNPFAVGDSAVKYVERAPVRLGLPASADFPTQRFIDALVGPAIVLGTANWLAANGIAFTLHGRGWAAHETLATHERGPIANRADFQAIVAAAGGVIDPFLAAAHPVRSLAVPTLKIIGRTPQRVLQDVAAIKAGRFPIDAISSPLTTKSLASFASGS